MGLKSRDSPTASILKVAITALSAAYICCIHGITESSCNPLGRRVTEKGESVYDSLLKDPKRLCGAT
jgi:hypothetical protein